MQFQPNTMIHSRGLPFAAFVLAAGLATAGTIAILSADLPALTRQLPKRTAQYAGEPFSLAVEAATGEAPLPFQWRKDGKEIPGATSATLNSSALTLTDAGARSQRHQIRLETQA